MARIRSFTHSSSNGSSHPTETDALWSAVQTTNSTFLQVSTYGSDTRVSKPKVSQTLQFDRASALLLKQAIEATFPEI